MTNPLDRLHAELKTAAQAGANHAGHEAVVAGVRHTENPARALLNVQAVHASFGGPVSATVTASQPAGLTPGGPQLPRPEGAADVMAAAAAAAGQAAALGK